VLRETMPISSDDQGFIIGNNYDDIESKHHILICSQEEYKLQLGQNNYKTSIDVDFSEYVLVGFCGKSSFECENKEFVINALISKDSQIIKFQVVNRLYGDFKKIPNRLAGELHWVLINKDLKDSEIIIEEKVESIQGQMDLNMIKGEFAATIKTIINSQVTTEDCNVLIDRVTTNNVDVQFQVSTESKHIKVNSEYITKFYDKIILEGNLSPYGKPKYEGDYRLNRCIFVQPSNELELVFRNSDSNIIYVINGEKITGGNKPQ